jgi:CubicO group peptidase (beta-lactamase class C family)
MKTKMKFLSIAIFFLIANRSTAQSYDFSAITQMLNDSSSLYLNRIYVEVFKNDTSIYQYQDGWIYCNNIRLGQGSATKWISSAIMLRLAEKGWWNLDDSIGTYLPIFTQYGKGHITIRQCYSMSSGMYNPGNGVEYHRDPSLTLTQSVDSIAMNVQILYPTGSMIGYDGTMMHVWGRAAEVVDSINGNFRDWRTIAKEEFFDLMGMDSTDYTDFYPNNPAVAGGIETTPCDWLKFLKMLSHNGIYNTDTILQPSSVDEMFTDQTNSAPIYYTYWPSNHPDFPNGLDTMRYTWGAWWTEKDVNGNIVGITSPGAYGHYPFIDRCRNLYGTFFCYIPPIQGGGAVVENTYLHFLRILRDTIGSSCNLPTGVDETTLQDNFNIYPNPTNNVLHLEPGLLGENYTVELKNSMGQQIGSYNNPTLIDLSTYSIGLYFIKIQSGNQVFTKKIIKQ